MKIYALLCGIVDFIICRWNSLAHPHTDGSCGRLQNYYRSMYRLKYACDEIPNPIFGEK